MLGCITNPNGDQAKQNDGGIKEIKNIHTLYGVIPYPVFSLGFQAKSLLLEHVS